MKKSWMGALTAVATLVSGLAYAEDGELVTVGATEIFAPTGFDDNDQTSAVLDGYLPSGCYKLAEAVVKTDATKNLISIEQKARVYPGPCILALIPYTSEVKLGILPKGEFTVSTNDGAVTEKMMVKEATSSGPDDHLYAPVESARVKTLVHEKKLVAVLEGRFTNTCMAWDKTDVIRTAKTVEILPVMKMLDRSDCEQLEFPFRVVVDMPKDMAVGRYLLHVRSLNGKSVNQVFSVFNDGF